MIADEWKGARERSRGVRQAMSIQNPETMVVTWKPNRGRRQPPPRRPESRSSQPEVADGEKSSRCAMDHYYSRLGQIWLGVPRPSAALPCGKADEVAESKPTTAGHVP